MKNFGMLAKFEYKKLLNRKIVWITMAVMIVINIFLTCSIFFIKFDIGGETLNGYEMKKRNMDIEKKSQGERWVTVCLKDLSLIRIIYQMGYIPSFLMYLDMTMIQTK